MLGRLVEIQNQLVRIREEYPVMFSISTVEPSRPYSTFYSVSAGTDDVYDNCISEKHIKMNIKDDLMVCHGNMVGIERITKS